MRTLRLRCILPPQAVFDHINHATRHAPVINARHTARQWDMWRNPRHLCLRQQKQATQRSFLEMDPESHSLAKE